MATRVLWLAKGLGPGGTERLLVELARASDPTRVRPTVAYVLPWKDHLAGELEEAGVATVCLSTRRTDARWPLRLRRLVATGDFDIVHSHSPVPAVAARVAVLSLPRARRPALVTTEHNTWTSLRATTRWASRVTAVFDAATFAVTAQTAASLRGAAAERAEIVVHGIDTVRTAARPAGEREAVRRDLGLRADEPVITTVANFRVQKDYPTLLAACRLLVERGVPFRLVAVGQGPLEGEITRLRDVLGLGKHVVLAGFRTDAVAVMAAADIFVLASAWEGLPVAAMEAATLGLPIVATAVGGLAEQFDASSAVLVAPRDPAALAAALEAVLARPRWRSELSTASRSAAARFDVRRVAATLATRYEQLAGVPPRSSSPPDVPALRTASWEVRAAEDGDREQILALLGVSLGWTDEPRSRELFAWKHERNPFGPSLAWVVERAGRVVAVRLFMRWEFRRGAATLPVVRAVDTATHPAHQGRGLFTALTRHALEACRDDGVAFVFNTPNEQSRPGYLKLGWREVGRPPGVVRPARTRDLVAIARSRVPADVWSVPLEIGCGITPWLDGRGSWPPPAQVSSTDRSLRTATDERFARWRYGLSGLHYRVVDDGDAAIVVRLRRRGASRELVVADRVGDPERADALAIGTLRRVGATHALRMGRANPRRGFVPVPGGGPILTWRGVCDHGPPPLPNWDLCLGDLELF